MKFNRIQVDVENGEILWKSQYHHSLWRSLLQASSGKRVWIEVYEHEKKLRTPESNRYYFGAYMNLIARETGNDVQSLHNYFRDELLPLLFPGKWDDKILLRNGETKYFKAKPSTTDLNKSEFSEYIMEIERITGITAPPVEQII